MITLKQYELEYRAPRIITSNEQLDEYTNTLIELEERRHKTAEEREYAQLLAALIEKYEDERYPIEGAEPVEILKELMSANELRQKDLAPLLGGESGISAILSGDRRINMDQAFRLGERFKVSPMLFMSTKPKLRHSGTVR